MVDRALAPRQQRVQHRPLRDVRVDALGVLREEFRDELDRVEGDLRAAGVGQDVVVHVHEQEALLGGVEEVAVLPAILPSAQVRSR